MSTRVLPLIAVLGATGAQGGGTVRALLEGGRFAVRALTRQPEGAAAQALRHAGAEVVHADLDDPATLRAAFAGAQGLFAVTPYWTHHSPEREFDQARHIAEAAAAAEVPHVVWSTQEDTRRWVPLEDERLPTLRGRWKVPHCDAKGAANTLFRERGVPTTLLTPSFFWENLIRYGMQPQRAADGRLIFMLPMGPLPLPGMAVADVGHIARAIFERPQRWIGKSLGVAGAHVDGVRMAAALARTLGEPVQHHSPRFAEVAALPFPGAAEMANMFRFLHDFNDEVRAMRPVAATRELHPGLLDFDAWLTLHGHRLPLERRGSAYEAGLLAH
ncbi:MAG: NmrA family NAD(P)-binding protein [Rubrivivax sp.]|nr:NmrA family NAD(P)-binding protein [Rubrivivax sp.]